MPIPRWSGSVTLSALIGGAALLAHFVLLPAKVTHPLLPLRVLMNRNRGGAYLAIFTVGVSIFGMFLFVTYYLQQSMAFTAVEAGLAFLPMTVVLAISARPSRSRQRWPLCTATAPDSPGGSARPLSTTRARVMCSGHHALIAV